MERTGYDHGTFLRLVFNASLASLAYEMALIRIFSISLWYHFAFMVISIAMLGMGASGTVLSLFTSLKDLRRIPRYGLMLAISIPVSYILANAVSFDPARLSWDRTQLLAMSLYYIILCVPFFFFGLIVCTAYSTMPREARATYAADLTGAGAGALAMVWLLSLGGPETSVFIISSLMATGLLSQVDNRTRMVSALLLIVNLAVLFVHPQFIQPRISPYKPFALALQFPGAERLGTSYSPYSRIDLFKSPAVRFAPGLSFTYLDPLPEQTGIAIDAGDIYAITDEEDKTKLEFIRSLPSSLAYRLSGKDDVLILEPRGGLALLTAQQHGAKNIIVVDSNPLVLQTVREYGQQHASHIYQDNAWTGLGRAWLTTSEKEFDLIDLSFMGSVPSATFDFAEDYRFTVEAFEGYIAHLKHEGFLSMNLYIIPPPRTELRLLATLAQSAALSGIRDIDRNVAVIRSWDTLAVLMKKSALSGEDIRRIKMFANKMRFDLVYFPGIQPGESNVHIKMPGNEYAEAFGRLMNKETRERFIADYLFDIRPVSDERPFFHYYLKMRNMEAIYRVMGEKWYYFIEEGYLLPFLAIQVIVVSTILVLLPLAAAKSSGTHAAARNRFLALSYFAMIGTGYLFVEIAFIQKMIFSLENPSYAASTVIASILISSGIGSLLSRRFSTLQSPSVLVAFAGISFVYSFLLPWITAATSPYPLWLKIVLSFFALMPAGVLMGIPFPLGISVLSLAKPRFIPWAWAVNGCFSVLAPVLAVLLALSVGFRFVLVAGAVMYLSAFWVIRREMRDVAAAADQELNTAV